MKEKDKKFWKDKLTDEQYRVLREKGTERPYTGKYDEFFEDGMYNCGACGQQLFESGNKYNSGCGWPAFDTAIDGAVDFHEDNTLGMRRTEVTCSKCGSHLGHVFPDGPKETTGERFCINSIALDFDEAQDIIQKKNTQENSTESELTDSSPADIE